MEQGEFIDFLADVFERRGVRYAVTGSHASMAYGEHRLTNDVDVVIDITPPELPALLREFPPEDFYVSDDGARHAAANGGQFNVIQPTSLLKADLIVPRDPDWPDQLARRRRLPTGTGGSAWFVAPEDLILRKMDFYREGGSEKHLRDIAVMLRVSGGEIDRDYLSTWSDKLGLLAIWSLIVDRVDRPPAA